MTNTPDLTTYDVILVNTSAGKDSCAMLDYVVTLATEQGVRDRVHAVHCDLGRVEWACTRDLAERQVAAYDLPFHVVSRPQGDLLVQIEQRGMWPSSAARYCTSDQKRGQVNVLVNRLAADCRARGIARPRILNCLGLRAAESSSRAKRPAFAPNARLTNSRKAVDEWNPIHAWSDAQVWDRIRAAGIETHPAYAQGFPRLSCVFCVFAPQAQLLAAARLNPALAEEYAALEGRIGHQFRPDVSIAAVVAQARDAQAA